MSDDNPLAVEFDFGLSGDFTDQSIKLTGALSVSATANLMGVITLVVDDAQLDLSLEIDTAGDHFGSQGPKVDVQAIAPTSASATVQLPAVSGGGTLVNNGDEWAGSLQLQLSTFAVDAFGIISVDGGVSFVVILCARFPSPGIQVGFGFAVSGVGGVFGLNRRSDRDALTAAVLDGSLAGLLFPSSAAHEDAQRITRNLPALFPAADGQILFGPMLEITWASGILTAEVMLLLELPDPLQVSILGRLTVDLPPLEDSIVHIEARVGAFITPSVPEIRLVASLTGSRIAVFALTGDLFLLIRGGPEATFVFSAGGFHPAVTPPPNVPPLKRLGMSMSLSFIELRCETYLAVTTSSVQVGAQVELTAIVDDCGIHGNFGFDALIEWKPKFHLRVDVHLGLAVEVFGENLCGVNFDGFLEGPGPWHLNGRGEVEVLWVSVAIPIDVTFGSAPTELVDVPDVGHLLAIELAKPGAWSVHPPAARADGVTLTPTALADLAAAKVLHPAGGLQVVQHLIPLEFTIDRFAGAGVTEQRWEITGVQFGKEAQRAPAKPVTDVFADGTFTTLTVEQQLSDNGFTEHPAGAEFTATGVMHGVVTPGNSDTWRDIVIGGADTPALQAWQVGDLSALIAGGRGTAATAAVSGAGVTLAAQPPSGGVAPALFARIRPVHLETWERG